MTQTQPQGFLAAPSGDQGPGVLVLHAWWGLNDTIKAFCTRLADDGFVAFAPDLYRGRVADDIPGAEVLRDQLDANADRAVADVAEAARFLRGRVGNARGGLAVVGFSLGAYFAFDLSVRAPDHIGSVVVYYGTRPGGDYGAAKASYLGHFAENDEFEPRSGVDELEESLRSAGRAVTFHHYAGTGHWFAEPDRKESYNQPAATLAWDRTLEFLKTAARA